MAWAAIYSMIVGTYITLATLLALQLTDINHSILDVIYKNNLTRVSSSVMLYLFKNGVLPAHLSSATDNGQFDEANSRLNSFVGYESATQVDQSITYHRFLIWDKKRNQFLQDSSVTNSNKYSGTDAATSFFSNGHFEPNANVFWVLGDDREYIYKSIEKAYLRLDETGQRLLYTSNGKSVSSGISGAINDGDSINLVDAVGYVGQDFNCSDVWVLDGAAVTCSDFWSVDGSKVVYQRIDDKAFILYVELSYLASNGESVIVAVDYRFKE